MIAAITIQYYHLAIYLLVPFLYLIISTFIVSMGIARKRYVKTLKEFDIQNDEIVKENNELKALNIKLKEEIEGVRNKMEEVQSNVAKSNSFKDLENNLSKLKRDSEEVLQKLGVEYRALQELIFKFEKTTRVDDLVKIRKKLDLILSVHELIEPKYRFTKIMKFVDMTKSDLMAGGDFSEEDWKNFLWKRDILESKPGKLYNLNKKTNNNSEQ